MIRTGFCVAACFASALLFNAPEAKAQTRVEVGVLRCTMSASIGALAGSRRRMACRFVFDSGQRTARYSGTITRLGFDIGVTAGGIMSWKVLTRTRAVGPSVIAGHYIGVSGDVSMGVGAGAKVLIGGSRRSTMLQPVALVGNVGVNLALGITGLTLRYSG
jgi:hypothetical protein